MKTSQQKQFQELLTKVIEVETSSPIKAQGIALEALELAIREQDLYYEMVFLEKLGDACSQLGYYRQARQHYQEALDIGLTHFASIKEQLFRLYLGLATIHKYNKEYRNALEYYYQILKYDDESLHDKIYEDIASLHFIQKDYDKALEFLHKGLVISHKYQNHRAEVTILGNIGVIYYHTGKIDKSIEVFEQSYLQAREHKFTKVCIYTLMNIGDIYISKLEIEKSKYYYDEALKLIKEHSFLYEEGMLLQKLGLICKEEERYEESLDFFNKSLEIAKVNNFHNLKPDCLKAVIEVYEKLRNFEAAYKCQVQLLEIREKELEVERNQKLSNELIDKEKEIEHLKAQNNQIEQKNALLRQFSHIVAHDLKEPLRNIAGFASLLERRYTDKLDDAGKEYIEFITASVSNMNNLLSDLLKFVTIDNKAIQKKEVNLNNTLFLVTQNIRTLLTENEVTLSMSEMPTVFGYRHHLSQLFQNLLQNAIKFRSEKKLEIEIKCQSKRNYYLFSVRDNGIGIPEKHQKHIFEIFRRLHKNGKYHGTGMGLALCQKIVDMHGGKIWVKSKEGEGSTFYFTIKSTPSLEELLEK